ncbi:MAG TPA: glycosyltransferase family 2 protein [Candidatus Hydrogenedentes bacterium]|nr:glycosyltransferase family 2 protein [Candidatus Hydrogenedentota bacterium]
MLIVAWIVCLACAGVAAMVAVNVRFWPRARHRQAIGDGVVSILIPARNEAERIGPCIESALAQGRVVGEVLVYNDHSEDKTVAVVESYATRDPRVRVIAPQPLPEGWCGKNFACFRLAQAATCPWLMFLDADTRIAPETAEIAVSEAEQRGATLLSLWPGLDLVGFSERLLMPMLHFIVFSLYPAPLAFTRRDASLGIAHGACMLAHRATYISIGGHEVVHDEIFEDTRLARAWRERGELSLCLDGQDCVRVRMYGSFGEIWRGFLKNFYAAFHGAFYFFLFLLFHVVVVLLPFVMLGIAPLAGLTVVPWILAAGLIVFSRMLLAFRFRQPLWSCLAHPVSESVLVALGVASWWRCVSGKGVVWKGRSYRGGESAIP